MEQEKRHNFIRFFISMKFSMFLLLVIIGVCIAGSLASEPRAYFSSWWVRAAAGILCLNLLLCSVRRLPVSIENWRRAKSKRAGAFGSWLCHLGMLLIILGFIAGEILSEDYTVYGIPGSMQPIADTGLWLRIDDFDVRMRDDFTVEQYTAKLTAADGSGQEISGEASVNHPMNAFGYDLFQDSTGWANTIDIYKGGVLQRSDIVCVGETTYPDDRPSLQVYFNKFYPDFSLDASGKPYSRTPLLRQPRSLFTVSYNGEIKGMDYAAMNIPVRVNEYDFVFRDPTEYTLIVIRRDPTEKLVGLAALIMLAGIFMAFYWRPEYGEEEHGGELHADET